MTDPKIHVADAHTARATRVAGRTITTASRRVIAEPAGLVFAGAFYLMVTAVLSALWRAATDANGGTIVGYTATALVWYAATAEACTIPLPQRLIESFGDDIGTRRVEIELLRPVSALAMRIATEVGTTLPRLGVCVVLGVPFALIVGGAPPSGAALALAVPSILLALALNLVAQHLFGCAAFWVLEAKTAWFLYQKAIFVLGGMLLPLEILPTSLETVARILPLSAMAYAPARLASGHVEPELLLIQLGWLVVISLVTVRAFRAGERRILEAAR